MCLSASSFDATRSENKRVVGVRSLVHNQVREIFGGGCERSELSRGGSRNWGWLSRVSSNEEVGGVGRIRLCGRVELECKTGFGCGGSNEYLELS
jgi:hypothetical protein